MPAEKNKKSDYQTLKFSVKQKGGASSLDQSTLKPSTNYKATPAATFDTINPLKEPEKEIPFQAVLPEVKTVEPEKQNSKEVFEAPIVEKTYAEDKKYKKKQKKIHQDWELLSNEKWLARNGHNLTYVGLYLFSVLVFFRPYELVPALSFLSATAFYFALATLVIYIPTQLSAEGTLTVLSTEVKCALIMTFLALLTIPIAKHPPTAWATFNETFSKAILMFVVMVNVLRTRRRLLGLMWISLSVGIYLSYTALDLYLRGELKVEGLSVD